MTPPPLDVENSLEVSLIKLVQGQSEPLPLTFPDVSYGYFPGRSLFLSSVIHELIIVALLLLSFALTGVTLVSISRACASSLPPRVSS